MITRSNRLTAMPPRQALGAFLAIVTLSGCAMIQSGSHIEINPKNRQEEIVTSKKCSPGLYPFELTAEQISKFKKKCTTPDSTSDEAPSSSMCNSVGAVFLVPAFLIVEAIALPVTLPAAIFTSDCSSETATRVNPNYRDESGRPARLSLASLRFKDTSDEGMLQGGDHGAIGFLLKNDMNAGPARDIVATIDANPKTGLRFEKSMSVGDLQPAESRPIEIPIEAADNLPDGKVVFTITFQEAGRNPPDPAQIRLQTHPLRSPHFAITRLGMDDGSPADPNRLAMGNGNGILEPGESVELSLALTNAGDGTASNVVVSLAGDDGKDLRILERGQFKRQVEIGTLRAHETKQAPFAISVSRLYAGSSALPLAIHISERRDRFNTTIPLGIKIGARIPQLQVKDVLPVSTGIGTPSEESVDIPPLTATPVNPDALAIVIGIEQYRQKGIPHADYASFDAQTVYGYLTQAMGYDPKNVVLLKDDQATKGDLEKYLGPWLKNRTTERSRVLIYFSGHGTPDPKSGEGFLVPYDGDPSYTTDTAFPLSRLYKTLARLPSKQITVALDSCFSGAGGRSILADGVRPLVSVHGDLDAIGKNTVVIAASEADQISGAYPQGQHGLLTFYLLSALHGAADAKHDGRITTEELFDYLKPAVERQARLQNADQVPTITPEVTALGDRADEAWVVLKPKQ
jgi:hypothetical protein